jgi:hypothetical protein
MKFLKDLGKRLGLFIAGIAMTVAGALFTYLEFASPHQYDYDSKVAAIPIVIFLLGIGCIIFTFKKNAFEDPQKDQKLSPPKNDGQQPRPLP